MTSPLDMWKHASLPAVAVSEWDSASAFLALAEIKRLRGQLAAAQALFTTLIEPMTGRDTKETLVRELGLSASEAAKAHKAATVVARVSAAAALLASGLVTADHLARLASVADNADASALLSEAVNQSRMRFSKRACGGEDSAPRKASMAR